METNFLSALILLPLSTTKDNETFFLNISLVKNDDFK